MVSASQAFLHKPTVEFSSLTLKALPNIPLISPGDHLGIIILEAINNTHLSLTNGDILVIAQKVVSKAEGRYKRLADVAPSPRALATAKIVEKDPRLVELILQESVEVVRQAPGVLIVESRLGIVHANAGIDQSNIESSDEQVLLLPEAPDKSAAAIQQFLSDHLNIELGVVISDSSGRAWRNGTTGIAIGVAGVPSVVDKREQNDLFGRPLQTTEIGFADEVASAASLLMGQADEACPVVLITGFAPFHDDSPAKSLLRARDKDLFR